MGWENREDDERHEAYLAEQKKKFWWRDLKDELSILFVVAFFAIAWALVKWDLRY